MRSAFACILFFSVLTPAQTTRDEQAVRAVLAAQQEAWNRGDLEGFMRGYWRSPDLTFYSGETVTSSWDATLERYRRRCTGTGNAMGKLDFTVLQVQMLGRDGAWVGGRWHLKMPDNTDRGGLFTLILRRFPEGWRIVHDHTS